MKDKNKNQQLIVLLNNTKLSKRYNKSKRNNYGEFNHNIDLLLKGRYGIYKKYEAIRVSFEYIKEYYNIHLSFNNFDVEEDAIKCSGNFYIQYLLKNQK